jgi:hypothetical protein
MPPASPPRPSTPTVISASGWCGQLRPLLETRITLRTLAVPFQPLRA